MEYGLATEPLPCSVVGMSEGETGRRYYFTTVWMDIKYHLATSDSCRIASPMIGSAMQYN